MRRTLDGPAPGGGDSPGRYTQKFHGIYPTAWPDLFTTASTSKPLSGIERGGDRRSFGPEHSPHKVTTPTSWATYALLLKTDNRHIS